MKQPFPIKQKQIKNMRIFNNVGSGTESILNLN
jgi:hypothetical protein